jgi:hypothetical protein
MVRKLLIVVPVVVLTLSVVSMFLPARQMDIEGIGRLSFETRITLSVGSEVAYASPGVITNSPSADSGGWTDPTNAYADDTNYASITSDIPSASETYSNYGFNLTGNSINQVRVRYDAWCAGDTANQQRVPTADGDVQGRWDTAPRWDDVDETTPNDADFMTGVSTSGGYAYCLFTFSPFSVPASSTITDLTVYFRARDWGGGNPTNNIRGSLRIGGTYYHTVSTSVDPGTSFTTYSYAYTANPATGAAWTVADINGTGANPLQQFGGYSTDLNPDIRVSMVYAQVNYAQYDEQIRVDVSWDGGTSWSSQQVTTLTDAEATYWYDVTAATAWTPDKLNDTNFRVRVDAYTQGTASEVRLDWIPVEVDYTPPSPPTGWFCGWGKRVKLTIDRNDIGAPLFDFPVLVYLSTSSGRGPDDVSFVFDELQSDANRLKIAVTTSDGTTQCYVEIEKWNQASGRAWLWVRVPSISNTADTDLYLYYDRNHIDNTAYVGDTNSTPAENVWDGNFKLVQHLGENSTVVHDSTLNNNDETNPPPPPPPPNPTPPYIRATYYDPGRINGAYSFSNDGTNGTRLQMSHSSSLDITQNITLEAFVYLNDKTDGKLIVKDDPFDIGGSGCYNLQQELRGGVPSLELQLDLGGWYRVSYGTYNTGEWIYIVGTYDRTTMSLYLNGAEQATNPQTAAIRSAVVNLALGNRADDAGTSYDLNGLLDEVRISDTPRSAAWIRASYESGRDHLIDFGSEEIFPADIENTPSEIDFGSVAENSFYWSNGSAPTFPLDNSECLFEVTNNSTCPLKILIRATDFSGGTPGWALGDTPGPDTVTLKVGKVGDEEVDLKTLANTDQDFITSLNPATSLRWELKMETPTSFSNTDQKTATITLTATSS